MRLSKTAMDCVQDSVNMAIIGLSRFINLHHVQNSVDQRPAQSKLEPSPEASKAKMCIHYTVEFWTPHANPSAEVERRVQATTAPLNRENSGSTTMNISLDHGAQIPISRRVDTTSIGFSSSASTMSIAANVLSNSKPSTSVVGNRASIQSPGWSCRSVSDFWHSSGRRPIMIGSVLMRVIRTVRVRGLGTIITQRCIGPGSVLEVSGCRIS